MNGKDNDTAASGRSTIPGLRKMSGCICHASFFLAGCSVTLPGRLVNKIGTSAKRILQEPRRRLCP
jgi:hypothetical protein